MFISDVPDDGSEHTHNSSKNKVAIGNLIMMSSDMLKVNGKIPSYNMWFFKFLAMFED